MKLSAIFLTAGAWLRYLALFDIWFPIAGQVISSIGLILVILSNPKICYNWWKYATVVFLSIFNKF